MLLPWCNLVTKSKSSFQWCTLAFGVVTTSMHVHFIIYSFVDHGLNQTLEYKNVHDIPIYMFCSFFYLCMYLYIHKQNSCRAMKDTINNTGCKSPWPSGLQ